MSKPDQTTIELEAPVQPAERVEDYEFEPIKGYPMLNWRGKRPFTSTQYYPAQLKEVHGEEVDGWRNKIYWGDNLQVMSHLLKEYRGKVGLIYLDPPFDSGANYYKRISVAGSAVQNSYSSFEEKQYTDIWSNDEYLQFMYERLVLARELLSDCGSIYLHCDSRKGPYLRMVMDELFGANQWVNEISWTRSLPHGNMSFGFGRNHDTILFYSKSSSTYWNPQFAPHRQEYIDQFFRHTEADGRRFRTVSCMNPNKNRKNLKYEWNGVVRVWKYTQERMQELHDAGLLVYSKSGIPEYKYYLDQSKGVPLQDTWNDIPPLMGSSKEKLDYPTQKPEALIERIIRASCSPGNIVFDCFMGSGTTQTVALKLGRRFIGADINLAAIQTTTKRLHGVIAESSRKEENEADAKEKEGGSLEIRAGFEVYNVNNYDIFRNPVQARDLLLEALEINKLEQGTAFDGEKDGRMVKIMPVNRIATRADLNELLNGLDYKAFERRQAEKPHQPVERITLVCMGHEPDLKAQLEHAAKPYKIDVEVVDILRDKKELEFKRDSEARVEIQDGELVIERFFPMNLLQKLSLQKEKVDDWRELVESVMVDWNYDGAVLQPAVVDIPEKNELVVGRYKIPEDAGTIRVKITDLLSESWEGSSVEFRQR